jgi:hypothetical protein
MWEKNRHRRRSKGDIYIIEKDRAIYPLRDVGKLQQSQKKTEQILFRKEQGCEADEVISANRFARETGRCGSPYLRKGRRPSSVQDNAKEKENGVWVCDLKTKKRRKQSKGNKSSTKKTASGTSQMPKMEKADDHSAEAFSMPLEDIEQTVSPSLLSDLLNSVIDKTITSIAMTLLSLFWCWSDTSLQPSNLRFFMGRILLPEYM